MSAFIMLMLAISSSLPGTGEPDLTEIADRYLAAERGRQREQATPSEVDEALAFLTANVVYEHPRVGFRIEGKVKLREGMLAFLGAVRDPSDVVTSRIIGPGVVVLHLRQSFEVRRENEWALQTRSAVKLLEFEGGRIRRIIDYW